MNAPTMVAQYPATAGPSRYQAPLPPPPTAPLAPIRTDASIESGSWSPLSPRSQNHVAAPPPLNMNQPQPLPQSRPQQYARELLAEPESPTTRNPLMDLMDTEKVYVEQLTFVIRVRSLHVCGLSLVLTRVQRVAAAWSRRDLPPPKLDAMFRAVEAVYRANRSFGAVSCISWPRQADLEPHGPMLTPAAIEGYRNESPK